MVGDKYSTMAEMHIKLWVSDTDGFIFLISLVIIWLFCWSGLTEWKELVQALTENA